MRVTETMIGVRHDRKRGCGWRKPGGLYLVADGLAKPCGKLPIPLTVCPTCHGGIKPTRGWTWVDGDAIAATKQCGRAGGFNGSLSAPLGACFGCPLSGHMGKCGLLWVGGQFYPSPDAFTAEAALQGVSRRISAVPTDFKVGETWVLVAHRECITVACPECTNGHGIPRDECETCDGAGTVKTPGIFHAFKPTAIEYVVKGDETADELESLAKRGVTPVRVERVEDGQMFGAGEELSASNNHSPGEVT